MANNIVCDYDGSVTPKKTKYLTPGTLPMKFSIIYAEEGTKSTNKTATKIQKEFQKLMKKSIDGQVKHLNTWLQQKDQLIAKMMKEYESIEKMACATATVAKAKEHKKHLETAAKIAKEMDGLQKDYQEIVDGWAKNVVEQQANICVVQAVNNVEKKKISNKQARVRLGLALKTTLVVAAIALSVAAIVITGGTAAPFFLGMAIAGAALAGIGSVGGLAKAFKKDVDIEKKILKSAQAEVKKVQEAMKPIEGASSGIGKHISELESLMKARSSKIGPLEMDVKKMEVECKNYKSNLAKLTDAKDQSAQQKKIADVEKQIAKVKSSLAKINSDNQVAVALLNDLKAMKVDLSKISAGKTNTVMGHIKTRFTTVDGLLQLSNDLGGLSSGIGGLDPS